MFTFGGAFLILLPFSFLAFAKEAGFP